jgi:lipoprotein-anchoring transpeptidase ErfK/SrfK
MKYLIPVLSLLLVACSPSPEKIQAHNLAKRLRAEHAALYVRKPKPKPCTFEDFIVNPQYRTTPDMWSVAGLKNVHAPDNSYVEIHLASQRGRLYVDGKIAMDFPICSGRIGGKETPKGSFRISQKAQNYRSNKYGAFMNSSRTYVMKPNVVANEKKPEGSVFVGASMPYWMRFNGSIGIHVGPVYRYGASNGCVRVPIEVGPVLFEKLSVGSKVIVK